MKLLHRYIFREILLPTFLAAVLISFLAVASEIRTHREWLPVAQLHVFDIIKLMAYSLPTLLPIVLGITYLIGILLAFGALARHGEIIAMKAAGIPLKRVVAPVLILGALLSMTCYIVQDQVQPWAAFRMRNLLYFELQKRIALDNLTPGVNHEFRGWQVYVGRHDEKTGTLHDIYISKPMDNGQVWDYHADEATMTHDENGPTLTLRKGHIRTPPDSAGKARIQFEECTISIAPPVPERSSLSRETMSLSEMLRSHAEESAEITAKTREEPGGNSLYKLRRDISERITFPLATFAVSLVAAPLGIRARRHGRSHSFVVGFSIVLFYFVGRELLLPQNVAPLGSFIFRSLLPSIVLATIGIVALWRVDRI